MHVGGMLLSRAPKGMESKRIKIRLAPEVLAELELRRMQLGKARSEIIADGIARVLNDMRSKAGEPALPAAAAAT